MNVILTILFTTNREKMKQQKVQLQQANDDSLSYNSNNNHNEKGSNMMMPDESCLDIDGLCEEMQAKARCSETGQAKVRCPETGLWYDKKDMKKMMAMMGKKTMPT